MISERFIKGKLKAVYSGTELDDFSSPRGREFDFRNLSDVELWDVNSTVPYEPKHLKIGNDYYVATLIKDATIYWNEQDSTTTIYQEDLYDVYLTNVKIKETTKKEGRTYGLIEADAHATLRKLPVQQTTNAQIPNSPPQKEFEPTGTGTGGGFTGGGPSCFEGCFEMGCGCWLPLLLLLLGLLFAGGSGFILPILGFLLGMLLLGLILRYWKPLFGLLALGFLLMALLNYFSGLVREQSEDRQRQERKDDEREKTRIEIDSTATDSTSVADSLTVIHHRAWNDYDGKSYEGDIGVRQSAYFTAKRLRETMSSPQSRNDYDYWAEIYGNLIRNDAAKLPILIQTFDSIQKANNLTQRKFLDMVVSCVQDIPYAAIMDISCEKAAQTDPYIRRMLSSCNCDCVGNIRFGLMAPSEFVYSLNGDCDTRTVLLFTLLAYYKYPVAILNSTYYRHSMLGVGIPVAGNKFVQHKGTRYYFWETTAPGFRHGVMPPESSNTDYWEIVLTN